MTLRLIFDDGQARLLLDQAEANARDLGPVMAAIAGEVDDRVQESFDSKTDPVDLSAWPELRPATVLDRVQQGFSATDTLQRTGILRAGVITEAGPDSVETFTRGVEYALIHQLGGSPPSNVPRRRFAGVSEEDVEEFETMLTDYILNG